MGVDGLTTLFYKKKASAGKAGGWVKKSIKGSLVVDGNCVCHQICDFFTKESEGINYAIFFENVAKIIRKFISCGIEPYFIFDGVDKPKKLTREHRKKAVAINKIPTLAYTVLYNALKEMEVKVYVADGEGDMTCAEVANFLKCPVLSCDSDFFLFDIPGGYIDFKTCLKEGIFSLDSATLETEVYYRKEFVRFHYPAEKDIILLFPAIVGNGIHPPTGHFIKKDWDWTVETVDRYVSKRHNLIANLHPGTRKNFEEVRKYYNSQDKRNPQALLDSQIPSYPEAPEWFHVSYRTQKMPYMLFDALINRKQHHSSSVIPKRIRQCCYTILGVPEVQEYCYPGIKEPKTNWLEEIPGNLTLHQIENEGDSELKRSVFYFALRCVGKAADLNRLSDKERFFMCTVIFWMNSDASPPQHVIKALLACFVCLSSKERGEIARLCRETQSQVDLKSQNILNEWQCVYQDALALFLLLRCSSRSVPCPSCVFDEKIILSLSSKEQNIDREVRTFIEGEDLLSKYAHLLAILEL